MCNHVLPLLVLVAASTVDPLNVSTRDFIPNDHHLENPVLSQELTSALARRFYCFVVCGRLR
jgi:hypothetical protein